MKRRIVFGFVVCLLLLVCWTFWWGINFINKHPDEYEDLGMPPIWDYRYWPLVEKQDVLDRRLQPPSPGSGIGWPLTNGSNGPVIVTNKPHSQAERKRANRTHAG